MTTIHVPSSTMSLSPLFGGCACVVEVFVSKRTRKGIRPNIAPSTSGMQVDCPPTNHRESHLANLRANPWCSRLVDRLAHLQAAGLQGYRRVVPLERHRVSRPRSHGMHHLADRLGRHLAVPQVACLAGCRPVVCLAVGPARSQCRLRRPRLRQRPPMRPRSSASTCRRLCPGWMLLRSTASLPASVSFSRRWRTLLQKH